MVGSAARSACTCARSLPKRLRRPGEVNRLRRPVAEVAYRHRSRSASGERGRRRCRSRRSSRSSACSCRRRPRRAWARPAGDRCTAPASVRRCRAPSPPPRPLRRRCAGGPAPGAAATRGIAMGCASGSSEALRSTVAIAATSAANRLQEPQRARCARSSVASSSESSPSGASAAHERARSQRGGGGGVK